MKAHNQLVQKGKSAIPMLICFVMKILFNTMYIIIRAHVHSEANSIMIVFSILCNNGEFSLNICFVENYQSDAFSKLIDAKCYLTPAIASRIMIWMYFMVQIIQVS
jgi:hypothetical protein